MTLINSFNRLHKFLEKYFFLITGCILGFMGFSFMWVYAYYMYELNQDWVYGVVWTIGIVVLTASIYRILSQHYKLIKHLDRLAGK